MCFIPLKYNKKHNHFTEWIQDWGSSQTDSQKDTYFFQRRPTKLSLVKQILRRHQGPFLLFILRAMAIFFNCAKIIVEPPKQCNLTNVSRFIGKAIKLTYKRLLFWPRQKAVREGASSLTQWWPPRVKNCPSDNFRVASSQIVSSSVRYISSDLWRKVENPMHYLAYPTDPVVANIWVMMRLNLYGVCCCWITRQFHSECGATRKF